jgi:hypothetical protein
VGVVNEAVEDAVSGRGIADLFMPARHRELRGEDGRAGLIAVLADLPESANSGKITSQTDLIGGEQIVYSYDAQNRRVLRGPDAVRRRSESLRE